MRYAAAHLAALRCAAAVLAARARPATGRPGGAGARSAPGCCCPRSRRSWRGATFFAAASRKRAAAEAGLPGITPREADDLLRDVETFLQVVETTLGVAHQPPLPLTAN